MHHFLKVTDFTLEQAQAVFSLAKAFKDDRFNTPATLDKQSWGLLFYKSSTRTRVSFEVGVNEHGGWTIVVRTRCQHRVVDASGAGSCGIFGGGLSADHRDFEGCGDC